MRREIWITAVLLFLTLAVYWPVSRAEFINFDDPAYVTDNPPVDGGLTSAGVAWAFTTGHSSNWHPVTWLSHMLDCQLFGLDAGRHHLVNLIFHVANTLLLFFLLRQMTGAVWRSALVAALFAWHPLHVESVAWISERKDVLSTFFALLTLLAYGRYVRARSKGYFVVALLCFAAGLMSKPMLVTLPFLMLLLDYWPLSRPAESVSWRKLVLEKIPFLLLAAISCTVTFLVQRAGGAVVPVEAVSLGPRLANAAVSLVRYLLKMIWPGDLAVFYPFQQHWAGWQVAGSIAALFAVTIIAVRMVRTRRYFAVGWFWYLGMMVPVIGLVQVGFQSMADRYTYVPLVGIFIMLVWGGADIVSRWPGIKNVAVSAAVLTLTGCLTVTWYQVGTWKNAVALYNRALAVTGESNFMIQNLLGMVLSRSGSYDEAIGHFRKAIQYRPDFTAADGNLGRALLLKGEVTEAVSRLRIAVDTNPGNPFFRTELGAALLQDGKIDEAVDQVQTALRIEPGFSEALETLGQMAWKLATSPEPAVRNGARAVGLATQADQQSGGNSPTIAGALAAAYAEAGRFPEAIAAAQRAIRLATQMSDTELAQELTTQLDAYRANRPFRDNRVAAPRR